MPQTLATRVEESTQGRQICHRKPNTPFTQPHQTLPSTQKQTRSIRKTYSMSHWTLIHRRVPTRLPPPLPRPAELPMRQHHPRIKKPHTKGLPQVRPAPTHLTQSIQTSRTLEPPRLGYRDSSPSRLPSQIRSLLKIRQHTKPTYRPSL